MGAKFRASLPLMAAGANVIIYKRFCIQYIKERYARRILSRFVRDTYEYSTERLQLIFGVRKRAEISRPSIFRR